MKYLKDSLIILFFSCITSFLYNYISPSGIALVGEWDKTKGVISAQKKSAIIDRKIEINSFQAMKAIVGNNKSIIIDVRSAQLFKEGHVPGAISFPLSEFDQLIGKFFESVMPDKPIIAYCFGRECSDSHTVAKKLSESGYSTVKVFVGGFDEWKDGGGKVEK